MRKMILTLIIFQTFQILTAPANQRFTISMPEPLSVELNWQNIRREIAKCDLKYPEIVMLQIRLESANLTSRLCKVDNNLLGMHYPKKRPTTATGKVKKNGMAHYDCWQDCIRDYKAWQNYMYKGGDYLSFLSRVYATDPYYLSKLKRL